MIITKILLGFFIAVLSIQIFAFILYCINPAYFYAVYRKFDHLPFYRYALYFCRDHESNMEQQHFYSCTHALNKAKEYTNLGYSYVEVTRRKGYGHVQFVWGGKKQNLKDTDWLQFFDLKEN